MANYDPNRPRPSVEPTVALPGDLGSAEAVDAPPVVPADTDVDPAPAPASHLLPRHAEPVDRRLLAAFGGAVAAGWLVAAVVAWWLWRRWRRRR